MPMASAGASALPRQVIALATVRVGKVIGEQNIGGLLKLAERAREGVVGVPIVEARTLEDQVGLARIHTVRRSQNHLPQLGGQMDFFAFLACCALSGGGKTAVRIQEEVGLVLLLLVDRVVKGGTDVKGEVNLGGGHFAFSVLSFVRKCLWLGLKKVFQFYGGRAPGPPPFAGEAELSQPSNGGG